MGEEQMLLRCQCQLSTPNFESHQTYNADCQEKKGSRCLGTIKVDANIFEFWTFQENLCDLLKPKSKWSSMMTYLLKRRSKKVIIRCKKICKNLKKFGNRTTFNKW